MNRDVTVIKAILPLIPLLAVTACVAPPKYNWGNYSIALVTMDNNAAATPAYTQSLEKIINNPDGKVPPGIYAEYGYMLQTQNEPKAAAAMYAREKAAWPESAPLMDKMILSLQNAPPAAAPAKPVS